MYPPIAHRYDGAPRSVDLEEVLAKVLGPALRHVGAVAGDMQAHLVKAMDRVGGVRCVREVWEPA
jgi:hypothetical protein